MLALIIKKHVNYHQMNTYHHLSQRDSRDSFWIITAIPVYSGVFLKSMSALRSQLTLGLVCLSAHAMSGQAKMLLGKMFKLSL